MCDRETATTRGCHLGYTDTLIRMIREAIFSLRTGDRSLE